MVALSSMSSKLSSSTKEPLPQGYSPSPESVVIGKGGHTRGRSRLRMIAAKFLEEYSQATTKIEKSAIVSKIVEIVQKGCPDGGAFIRFADGRWWEVDSSKAREKVGYVLRDLLHDKYRSSSTSKAAARRRKSLEKANSSSSTTAKKARSKSASSQCLKSVLSSSSVIESAHPRSASFSIASSSSMIHRGSNSAPSLSNSFGIVGMGSDFTTYPSQQKQEGRPNPLLSNCMNGLVDCQPIPSNANSSFSLRNSAFSYLQSFGHQDELDPIPFSNAPGGTNAMPIFSDNLVSQEMSTYVSQQQQHQGLTASSHVSNNNHGQFLMMEPMNLETASSNDSVPFGEDLSSVFD